MIRERALKVVLVIVGLLFLAGVYALTQPIQPEERERFRQRMRERFGFGPSTGESKAQ